jgi:gliding motility-associated-like protein
MIRLLICCLLSLSLSSQKVLADTFIVTSTASAGDGSLRDALEKAAANGTATPDLIIFNITRAREVVIQIPLNNLLPALSGNLTIDGTTQPGPVLGASEAKVGVKLEGMYSGTNPLYLFDAREASNVKIYGLFMKGNVGPRPAKFYAVMLQGSRNITIGEPGKGNVISGWSTAIFDEYDSRYGKSSLVTISSNIFGLDTDGISTSFTDRTGGTATNTVSVHFKDNSNNFTIGGATPDAGNRFNSSNIDIILSGELQNDATTTIAHNTFGLDIAGDNLQTSALAAISVSRINTFPNFPGIVANPVITNNYIGGRVRGTGILCTDVQTHFLIADNILGYEDRSGGPPRDIVYGTGITIRNSFQATVKNNTIRYWSAGALILDATYSIRITNNSTYCNKKRAIELRNWFTLSPAQRPQPYVYINSIDPFRGVITGKSLPNNIIEIFQNENCPTCEGKTYLGNVTSDAGGNWVYNGTFTGENIAATATEIFFATSEYSMPKIDTSALAINPVTCAGGFGGICGVKILSGTRWRWEDENGAVVGYDTCLRLVPAGRYFLKLAIGTSCEETFRFTIPDVSPAIDVSTASITPARCGAANGGVCGLRVRNGVSLRWEDESGNIISTNLCMNNARPGRYRLRLQGQQNCIVYSPLFDVPDKVPRIDASNATLTHPSCGRNNGSITGIRLSDMEFSTRAWFNEFGVQVGTGIDLLNVGPGRYKLVVKDNSGLCGDSTVLYTLNIVPPPAMNTAAAQVGDATCGQNNGNITGISFSNIVGAITYSWVNQAGSLVATTPDLLNAGPGTYRLKAKDNSPCDTLYSPVYTIADRGSVTLDSSALQVAATGCNRATGSIRGMRINGATLLEWRNLATGAIVSNVADVTAMPAGSYQLTATNTTYNCTVKSGVYTIPQAAPLAIEVLADSTKQATCGLNNGSIRLVQFSTNQSLFSFRWLKDSTTLVGAGLSLSNLSPCTYYCIATDTNGCEAAIYKKTIAAMPLPVLNETNAAVFADTCQFKTGRITGITASSDIAGLQYAWYTTAGQEAGRNLQLTNLAPGDYYLVVTDARGCTARSSTYTVPAITTTLPAPRYNTVINIARGANAQFSQLDSRAGTFELRDRITNQLLATNTTGSFTLINVLADRELEVSYTNGPCSSGRVTINIKVFDETRLTIPNAFSPNNDGINDVFRIQVQGYFKLNSLKIYNRYGQKIHETRDLNLPWDGRRNGSPLPVGTYYWVIEGIDMHNKLLLRTGSITLIR